ncbi:MAG: hypothetical protein IJU57_03520 [Clostridia bacterium]|nr:hypothetical protein [Clostridia bacterium]
MEEKGLVEITEEKTPVTDGSGAESAQRPVIDPEYVPAQRQPNILVFGILALALGYQIGIPGIILGLIGRSKGNKFLASGGVFTKSNKVGYILSKAGFIVGIVSTVIVIIAVVMMIVFIVVLVALIAGRGLQNFNFNDILMFR